MSDVEFLIDENITGLDRYLEGHDIKFRKVGDSISPELGTPDPLVAKFAKNNNLVVITMDNNLAKQCEPLDVDVVFWDLRDLSRKVKEYADSH